MTDPATIILLTDAERGTVLRQLIDTVDGVAAHAEVLALEMLTTLDRDEVAGQVQDALESVSTGQVAAVSGRQPRGGYVDHYEASTMLLQDAVEPFVDRMRALAEAEHLDIAAELGAGILAGLDRARGDEESAIYFDDQFAESHTDFVLDEMERLGIESEVD